MNIDAITALIVAVTALIPTITGLFYGVARLLAEIRKWRK
jgi:hypothetical protein